MIINKELFFIKENINPERASLTIQSIMLNGKVPMSTVAGRGSAFLRRPSGKKLHAGKMGGYIHGATNLLPIALLDTVKYGQKKLNTM